MSLYTDGTPANIEDLRRFESRCEELARDADVDLDQKLEVAAEEVGQEILGFLMFQGLQESRGFRQQRGLRDVVVTDSVRRWHATRSLAGLYRDVSGSDGNDRFHRKWKEYEKLSKAAAEQAFTSGIGLARMPVPRAPLAAVAETGTGQRVSRNVQITWSAADGSEGAPGPECRVMSSPGDVISAPWPPPEGVTGWNVYIGIGDGVPLLQNETPMPVEIPWQVPFSLNAGKPLRTGQDPDFFVVERRILPRG